MSYTKWLGSCALIAVLLSGCGTNSQGQTNTAAASPAPAASAEQGQQNQNNQQQGKAPMQMNEQERQLMMTFQTLLRMDKTEGLSITKEQAQAMLPVVQDSISKKELSTDAKGKLLEKLTADQKKFVDNAAANMQNRQDRNQMGKTDGSSDKSGTPSGKGDQAGQAPKGDQAGQAAKGDQAGQGNKSGQTNQGSKGENKGQGGGQERPGRNGGGGMNAGQQLVELLQSKTK